MSANPLADTVRTISRPPPAGAKFYDAMACSPLLVWYGICLTRQVPQVLRDIAGAMTTPSFAAAINILSETAVLLFAAVLILMVIARQPAAAKARGLSARATAFLGAFLGVAILALPRYPLSWELKLLSTAFILGGMGFALWGLLWLGRSFSIMSEARNLVVDGPYAFVRHPLYLGEYVSLIGLALQYISPAAVALLLLQFLFQLRRMGYEEAILAETFPQYREYKTRTARLIPGFY